MIAVWETLDPTHSSICHPKKKHKPQLILRDSLMFGWMPKIFQWVGELWIWSE